MRSRKASWKLLRRAIALSEENNKTEIIYLFIDDGDEKEEDGQSNDVGQHAGSNDNAGGVCIETM